MNLVAQAGIRPAIFFPMPTWWNRGVSRKMLEFQILTQIINNYCITVIQFYFGAKFNFGNFDTSIFSPELNFYLYLVQSLHMCTLHNNRLRLGQSYPLPIQPPCERGGFVFLLLFFFWFLALPKFSPYQNCEFWLHRKLYTTGINVDYSITFCLNVQR